MGSHVSCWYRQLFELSLNGFRRLCNGTNGPASPGTALPLLERQLALGRVGWGRLAVQACPLHACCCVWIRLPLFIHLKVHNIYIYVFCEMEKWDPLNRSVKYYTFLSKWEHLIVFHWIVRGLISLGMVSFLILLNTNVKLPPPLPFCHHFLKNIQKNLNYMLMNLWIWYSYY